MTEKILSIREVDGFRLPEDEGKQYYRTYEGYEVLTDKQQILVLVGDESSCCESWGHVASEDDLLEFLDANLLEVTRTDEALNTKTVVDSPDEGGTVFVTFKTDRGPFQLAVYNRHNGYYVHHAKVISQQLMVDEAL